jgi:hypothetical protein
MVGIPPGSRAEHAESAELQTQGTPGAEGSGDSKIHSQSRGPLCTALRGASPGLQAV